jgi:hypothetical protein
MRATAHAESFATVLRLADFAGQSAYSLRKECTRSAYASADPSRFQSDVPELAAFPASNLPLQPTASRRSVPEHFAGYHGDEVWLIAEKRTEETRYYASNLPPNTSLKALAESIKARWVCEQAHQQMKEELGLDHFEGRSWLGLHHHALLTMIAFAFMQHIRARENKA